MGGRQRTDREEPWEETGGKAKFELFDQNEPWGRTAPLEAPSAVVIPVQLRSCSHWGSRENYGVGMQINDCTKTRKKFICRQPRADLLSRNKPNGGVMLLLLPLGRRWTLHFFVANEHLMLYEELQQQPSGSQKRRRHSLPLVQCSRRRNGCQSVSMNSRH